MPELTLRRASCNIGCLFAAFYQIRLNGIFITLFPQHYNLIFFISTWATVSCSEFCHARNFTYLSVAKNIKWNSEWHGKNTNKIWETHSFWRNFFYYGAIWCSFSSNSIAVKKLPFSQRWENGKKLEIFFELFQYIASGGVLIHNFRMLMTELAPFHHSLILSGLWL